MRKHEVNLKLEKSDESVWRGIKDHYKLFNKSLDCCGYFGITKELSGEGLLVYFVLAKSSFRGAKVMVLERVATMLETGAIAT